MCVKKVVSSIVTVAMLGNMSAPLVAFLLVGGSVTYAPAIYAQTAPSNTPVLDALSDKFDLKNATRNHQTDTLSEDIETQLASPAESRDLSEQIIRSFSDTTPSRTLDFNKYSDPSKPAPTFNDQKDTALNLSKTHGAPSGTVSTSNTMSDMKVEYARKGTRKFVRDENGKLVLQVVEGVDRVSSATASDVFSSEVNGNPGYSYESDKQSLYGDEAGILAEGKTTNTTFKDPTTGTTASARGYRAITRGAKRALKEPNQIPLLGNSFDKLQEAQDPNLWLSSCTTTTVNKPQVFTSVSSTEHFCQDTSQSKMDFCEVERIIEPLAVLTSAEGVKLEVCGAGCLDVSIGDKTNNVWSGNCKTVTNKGTFQISKAYAIDSVTVTETRIDDHAVLKVNGDVYWSLINGVPGSSGSLSTVTQCERKTSYQNVFNGNLQSGIIAGQASADGVVNLQLDTLVGGGGEGFVKFRIRFSDPSGNKFQGKFIQYPAGCYDALKLEQKVSKPLTGIYSSAAISDSVDVYSCTAPKAVPKCEAGDFLLDIDGVQSCFAYAEAQNVCSVGSYNSTTSKCELPNPGTCPAGTTLNGSVCESDATVEHMCANGSTPFETAKDGSPIWACEAAELGFDPQAWSCPSPFTFQTAYCDITRGSPNDTANCAAPKVNTDFEVPSGFCTFDQYSNVREGTNGLPESFLSVVPPFYAGDAGNKTWRVNLDGYACDPTEGQVMCFSDPDTGERKCRTWDDIRSMPDQCKPYKDDTACKEIKRECTEGWLEPHSNRCMAYTVTYQCDTSTTIDYNAPIETNTCESMIPCAGGDCEIGEREQNDKFVQAMVAGSILDNIQGDSECTDQTDPSTCTVFNGEYKYCSWETTGLGQNCCEEAKGVDILGYIVFAKQMLKVNQMAAAGELGSGVQGTYQTLSQPISNAYDAVKDWAKPATDGIRSATETIFGNAGSEAGGVSGISEGIEAALAELQQEVYQFVYDMLPDSLSSLIFTETANTAGGEASKLILNETISETFSMLISVYTVYSLTKLALTLLTACDKYEMDMGVKLAMRQCFKVEGSYCSKRYPVIGGLGACMQKRQDYCCFSSILARIIVKESYQQLSINPLPFGNGLKAETPEALGSCPGLTVEQLGQVDFSKPSMQTALNEWIGLLMEAGEIPTSSDEQSLTGGATSVDKDCPPTLQPVTTCYIDAETGQEVCQQQRDAAGNLMYTEVAGECVKQLTPGQIWNANDRVTAGERIAGEDGYINGAADRVEEGKEQSKTIIGTIDCSKTPRPKQCDFGFDPTDE